MDKITAMTQDWDQTECNLTFQWLLPLNLSYPEPAKPETRTPRQGNQISWFLVRHMRDLHMYERR